MDIAPATAEVARLLHRRHAAYVVEQIDGGGRLARRAGAGEGEASLRALLERLPRGDVWWAE